ncbi:MAG: LLM class F420-dependent oxidoreductase [Jatrophihabitans sp.]|nr:MAG: LLM class F420-dependent oxidoreductase [Jatrophihabitans sp.]
MTHSLGVVLSQAPGRDPRCVLDGARAADELNYPELWLGEMAMFDAFALATAAAHATSRIALTVGPLAVDIRTPVGIAMGVGSVAALTGRRVGVALGTSSPVVVERWHGRVRECGTARLADSVAALRLLLAGEKVDFDGAVLSTHGFRLLVPPEAPSVTIAAFGERAVRVAARHADRMVLNLVTPATVRRLRGMLEAAAPAGRTPRLAVWVSAALNPTPEALTHLRRAKVGYLAAPGYGEMFTEAGFGDLVAFAGGRPRPAEVLARIPDELPAAVGAIGDVDTVRARVSEYFDAGADEVVLNPATEGDPGGRATLALVRDLAP